MPVLMNSARWVRRTLDYGSQAVRDLPWHWRVNQPAMPSRWHRILEQARLLYTSGIDAEDYYHHGLYRANLSADEKQRFLGFFRCSRYYDYLNPKRFDVLARDKVLFHMLARSLALPVPELLAVTYSPGQAVYGRVLESVDDLRDFLREEGSEDLFLKPAGGMGGEGALSLGRRVLGNDAWERIPDGRIITQDEVVRHICQNGQMRRFLIQKRIRSHQMLDEIVPNVCSTVRLMTLYSNGQVNVLGAALRFGNGRGPTDNLSGGGVVAQIDMDSGRLGRVVTLDKDVPEYLSAHPMSGVPITGKVLQHWNEVLNFVVEAANKISFIPCIGWDIALTHEGPVIVEINTRPRSRPIQIANDQGLLTGEFLHEFLKYDGTLSSGLHLRNL